MTTQQHNITIGTAGHVDHGKTALVKLLTGCDTDRLKIEKERGMSIELGFAPCVIADLEVGIVDVPGHENFVKTMVAGASGIDGCILVVAADDGVMPQTREHFDILTLLGVRHGIVALTKVDAVPPERTQAATQEIRQFVTGTFLQDAPILPISNITGEGFGGFYEALKAMVAAIAPKTAQGIFRIPVERAFAAKGYGTIVAGIPTCGAVGIGDEVEILPQRNKGRVRAVQVYGRDSTRAMAGQCAAINIPQWDHKDIQRGNVISISDYFAPHPWYLCEFKLLDDERADFKNGARVRFHTGTSETTAAAYLFQEGSLKPGQRCLIQVFLNEPVVAGPRDHFILRSLSPMRTLGGGIVVEAIERRLKRTHPGVLAEVAERAKAVANPKDFVEYSIRTAESVAADETQISVRTKTPLKELAPLLVELTGAGRILPVSGRLYVHVETAQRVRQQLLGLVRAFHRQRPESPGIVREQLMTESAARKEVFDALIERLRSEGKLVERKGCLALPEHREQFNDAEQQLLQSVESMFKMHPFSPPGPQEVADKTRTTLPQVQRAIRILIEQQKLVRVEQDLYFHADAVADARQRLIAYIKEHNGLESVQFKYVLDTTRKYAIPLLDYFDKIGLTRRVGYTRLLR
ncbi:MAG TPA: selenocysteine-specific translation elongation factor [Sedimentisphaerales bacterium]|jgi:selenocysteine-specific elongation factor|nr:selenocysteine-specific translation elongation factor [Sedimentisphaerales bacterium]HNU30900.1 selenocysteine-specific translation elongation factor [Sedimentisphaerales bacterium]